MSYLLQHARRHRLDTRASTSTSASTAPGLYGDAFVRVFVEDTSRRRRGNRRDPHTSLKIADCANTITLEFSLDDDDATARTRSSRSTR